MGVSADPVSGLTHVSPGTSFSVIGAPATLLVIHVKEAAKGRRSCPTFFCLFLPISLSFFSCVFSYVRLETTTGDEMAERLHVQSAANPPIAGYSYFMIRTENGFTTEWFGPGIRLEPKKE